MGGTAPRGPTITARPAPARHILPERGLWAAELFVFPLARMPLPRQGLCVGYLPEITIADAVRRIQKGDLILPAIQREYVWKPVQVVGLFDSLMRGYPVGGFLSWRVESETASQFRFYGLLKDYSAYNNRHNPDVASCPHACRQYRVALRLDRDPVLQERRHREGLESRARPRVGAGSATGGAEEVAPAQRRYRTEQPSGSPG